MKRRDAYDQRSLGYALKAPIASGSPHEFFERVNSNLCHLCWMPRGHRDHAKIVVRYVKTAAHGCP